MQQHIVPYTLGGVDPGSRGMEKNRRVDRLGVGVIGFKGEKVNFYFG
jgi:hypothetical protein